MLGTMMTKQGVEEMCAQLINGLSWIDQEEPTELINRLRTYRQELIDLSASYCEGDNITWPQHPINASQDTCC